LRTAALPADGTATADPAALAAAAAIVVEAAPVAEPVTGEPAVPAPSPSPAPAPFNPITSTPAENKAIAKLMEAPDTPTFLGFCGAEWHAIVYGLKSGFKVWNRTHTEYSAIDKLDISPELKADLKYKYHYLTIAEDLPEDVLLLAVVGYLIYTGQAAGLAKMAISFFGIVI
jgi:hypothetical protein